MSEILICDEDGQSNHSEIDDAVCQWLLRGSEFGVANARVIFELRAFGLYQLTVFIKSPIRYDADENSDYGSE